MTTPSPQQLAQAIIDASPARDTIVLVRQTSTVNCRWARNTLTTNGDSEVIEVIVTAISDGPSGPRCATLARPADRIDPTAIAVEAHALARRAVPASDAAPLISPTPASQDTRPNRPDAPDWSDPHPRVEVAQLSETLAHLGPHLGAGAAGGSDALLHTGYVESETTSTWLATSAGLQVRHDQPASRLEMTIRSTDGLRSTWIGHSGNAVADARIDADVARARTHLEWQKRRVEVPPGRHPAILSPATVADLMVDLYYGAEGRPAADGRTAFSSADGGTRLGQRLSDRNLTLRSDPNMPGQGCAPVVLAALSGESISVFDNGLALGATDWIRDGELHRLITSRHTAEETGLPLAPAVDNLTLDAGGSGDLEDLISRTEEGLLVTCTWYNRMVDPATHLITGLTRDGVYVVRGGEVIGAAGNYRFNDSPVAMLRRITDAATPVATLGREMADYFPRTTMPALAVDAVNFSTRSDSV